ncbi:MAG: hypothetical protein LBV26_06245, partial [Bacteroidales bacterium]|nr:hypothetical protein [Bacteroidales bacterium]
TLTPNLAVANVRQTVQFYCENLGFQLVLAVPETQDGVDQQLPKRKSLTLSAKQLIKICPLSITI